MAGGRSRIAKQRLPGPLQRRRGRTPLLIAALCLTLVAAAPPQREEVRIAPWVDEVTIGPGQAGVIRWSWVACTRGLTDDWVRATEQWWFLKRNGIVIQQISAADAARLWSSLAVYENPDLKAKCVWPTSNLWRSEWTYDKLRLTQPGDYQLQVYVAVQEPLIDGGSHDGDPQVDWWPAGVRWDRTITIHVQR